MTIQSATIGEEIFLQGQYLSLGLNSSGSLGTRAAAPSGFHTDTPDGFIRLGLVADTDGFGTGHDQTRDVMLSGTPVEGFSIGYKQGGSTFVNTNEERDGYAQIKGVGTNRSAGTTAKAEWAGSTAQDVKVDQVMSLSDDAKYIRVDVTLTNASGTAITDLRYLRTIDPDHGSGFSTTNQIVQQGGDNTGGALIAAYASPGNTPAFYYTQDERATVSSYGLENHDPYAAALTSGAQAKGYSKTVDANINIDFALGTLAAGATTTLTFYLGVTDDLAATVKAIDAASGPTPPQPVNHAPVAVDDAFTLAAGAALSANVLANDKDADGDTLHAAIRSGPAHGSVTLNDDGSFKYTPTKGYAGQDAFSYNASDGTTSSSATVTLTVAAPPNAAPVAVADSATVAANASVTGNVLSNDHDADGDALHAAVATGPNHGTLILADNGAFTYTPTAGYSGADSFSYGASDGKASSTATVTITVTPPPPPPPPPNTPPKAVGDTAIVMAGASVGGNVLANDNDADGDALHAAIIVGPTHGTVSLADNGDFTYTAAAGYSGADAFTYAASDGHAASVASVTITVTPPPPPPAPPLAPPAPPPAPVSPPEPAPDPAPTPPVVTPPTGAPGVQPTSVLDRAGVHDGSASTNDVMIGTSGTDTYYFNLDNRSGADKIGAFGHNDVLATNRKIFDGNNDGIVAFSSNKLSIDGPGSKDTVTLSGVKALRLLGSDDHGVYVYADASVRPKGALEGTLWNDVFKGDVGDRSKQVDFFDTALDLYLGKDTATNFGAKDLLITTSALALDINGHASAGADGTFALTGPVAGHDLGHVGLTDMTGAAVAQLEFDGSTSHAGTTYYVYSTIGSTAGMAGLVFG